MKTREELLQLIPKQSICAEIGVFQGSFSKIIKNTVNPSKLFLVDLFEGTTCSGDKHGNNVVYLDLSITFNLLKEEYKSSPIVEVFKGTSESFLKNLPDNYLDFVYIDGDHAYSGVSLDLKLSRDKVKCGGIIAGHDYTPRFQGTIDAVDEFIKTHVLKCTLTTDDGCPSYFIINKK
jgi:hypothetical protein